MCATRETGDFFLILDRGHRNRVDREPLWRSAAIGSRDSESARGKEQRKVEKKRSERPPRQAFRWMKVIGESQLAPSISHERIRARTRERIIALAMQPLACTVLLVLLFLLVFNVARMEKISALAGAQPGDFT